MEHTYLPEPNSMPLSTLLVELEKGIIKVPQFQRDFVWDAQKSADLIDSIIKGYPIGTFIFWKTREELRVIRNIAQVDLPPTPDGDFTHYVLDGQQRLTSLYSAVNGLVISRSDGRTEDFSDFHIDLRANSDEAIATPTLPDGASEMDCIPLKDLISGKIRTISKYPEERQDIIQAYKDRINAYQFATITLKEAPIEVATEVFTRLNITGQDLTLFEIMVAKTYDSQADFDLAQRYSILAERLAGARFGTLSGTIVLQAVSACIKQETSRKAILQIPKAQFIESWPSATQSLERAVDYFRNTIGVPVSELLPYPALLIPFTYYFFRGNKNPDNERRQLLTDFFWRVSLGERYSYSANSRIAADIEKMDSILSGQRPSYDWEIDNSPEYIEENGFFSTSRAYIKAILCLYAGKHPLSFRDNSTVNIRNDWLSRSNSRNYHHFFPKSYMKDKEDHFYVNHIVNITLVDDQLNKKEIGSKPPSRYIRQFEKTNDDLPKALRSHFISLDGFGLRDDDYDTFFQKRAARIGRALDRKVIRSPEKKSKSDKN